MHHVIRRGKYHSIEESFRDENGKPRKRIVRYLGIMPVNWKAFFAGDGKWVDDVEAALAKAERHHQHEEEIARTQVDNMYIARAIDADDYEVFKGDSGRFEKVPEGYPAVSKAVEPPKPQAYLAAPQPQPLPVSSSQSSPAPPAEALSVVGGSLEAKQVDNDGQEQEVHEASANDDVADVGEVH